MACWRWKHDDLFGVCLTAPVNLWIIYERQSISMENIFSLADSGCKISAAGSFILKITYGYNIEPHQKDPLVNLADLALQQFSNAIVPGAWLVDVIPACKFLVTPGSQMFCSKFGEFANGE